MDSDRITGAARTRAGKVEEGFGRLTGDRETQGQGIADQIAGTATNTFGRAKDTVRDAASSVSSTVEHSPLGSLLAAAALGFVVAMVMKR
jgi:uncharacterized protein YjbJ (UPF0337 family)